MRTTITLDDTLLARIKDAAHAAGTTVSGFIQEATKAALARDPGEPGRFRLITFGASGALEGVDLARTSALTEVDDAASFGGARGPP